MRKGFLVIFLFVLYLLSLYENLTYRRMPLPRVYGGWIIRLPSKSLKYFSLGYENILSDLVYIWSIQYFSSPEISNKKKKVNLEKFFRAVWSLDPKYLETYSTAALIANYDFGKPKLAVQLLLEGVKRNPQAWELLSEAAFYAFKYGKDYKLAHDIYLKAYRIRPDPYFLSMAAAMLEKKNLLQLSWRYWMKVYETAEKGFFKEAAERHLYRLKAKFDIDKLEEAVKKFKGIYGEFPSSLGELKLKGFLDEIPRDFQGESYIYDPKTGEINPRRKYLWK